MTGCATNPPANSRFSNLYLTRDGRTIEIGASTPTNGGWRFKEPHLDQGWVADDFAATNYDVLYIAPVRSTVELHANEIPMHRLAEENLVIELRRLLAAKKIFPAVVTEEFEIKPGSRVLRFENVIVAYGRGNSLARVEAGLYGAGQPLLRVRGTMTDGDKTVLSYEAQRNGVSRLFIPVRDEDAQLEDIRSLAIDLSDFVAAVSGKYRPKD